MLGFNVVGRPLSVLGTLSEVAESNIRTQLTIKPLAQVSRPAGSVNKNTKGSHEYRITA